MLLVFITGCLAAAVGFVLLLGPKILEGTDKVLRDVISFLEQRVVIHRIVVGLIFLIWGFYFVYLYFAGLKELS